MAHALIVEHDADSARMLTNVVGAHGLSSATAPSLRNAREQLAAVHPDLVLLDVEMPDGSGMQLFEDRSLIANSEVVLMTGQATLESSIEALRHGAADYLVKPVSGRQLQSMLARITGTAARQLESPGPFGAFVGRSAAMLQVYEQIARVAPTSLSVLVTGESGTGKELVARAVHDMSRRRDAPFVALNCGAISPNLVESEIFGHERGSFTGADRQHQGYFGRAKGGTLFLDEITEMPLALQVKLLRVLETGGFMRVGSTLALESDVRLVAATNRDPAEAVASGALREDLYWRLNVFPIELPPLRDRVEDLPLLASKFLAELGVREGAFKRITSQALAQLAHYRWPGNVRELRNVLQRAYVMTSGADIADVALPRDISRASADGRGGVLQVDVGTPLADIEKQVILATLEHFGHQRERAAAALGVSLKTLYNRLKNYSE